MTMHPGACRHSAFFSALFLMVALSLGSTGAAAQSRDDFIRALTKPAPAEGQTEPKTRGIKTRVVPMAGAAIAAPSISTEKITFDRGSATLTPQGETIADELGHSLKSEQLKTARIRIIGHTDSVGEDAFNLKLSLDRATTVAGYLVNRFSIDPTRLETQGMGESQLADPSQPDAGVNRRVEIIRID
ncbi:MAG: hypothetical protein RLY86_41 [Pseudomonadota bacterium]|jgi:outer membrane protein OmpA-like peptidoglycan-associated protein